MKYCNFINLLIYKKVPGLINKVLDDKISEIKKKVEESEKLKNDSEKLLSAYQAKLNDSKKECDLILQNAKRISDKDSKELTEKFNAVKLVKLASEVLGGKGGGGRKDFAQAGGSRKDKIDEAFRILNDKIS